MHPLKLMLVAALATAAVTAGTALALPDEADVPDPAPAPATEPEPEPAAGTVGTPAEGADGPVYDCREIDGSQVCDTFGESDEGPGTTG